MGIKSLAMLAKKKSSGKAYKLSKKKYKLPSNVALG